MELEKRKEKRKVEKRKKKRKVEKRTNQCGLCLSLPHHIVAAIFSKLPISNLPACRLVCKSWNRLILEYATTFSRKAMIYATSGYNCRNFKRPCFRNPNIHCFDIDTLSFVASCTLVGPHTDSTTSLNCCCNGLLFIENGGVKIGTQSPGIFNPMTHEFFPIPDHKDIHVGFYDGFGFSPKTKQYKLFLVPCFPPKSKYYMKILRFGRNPNQWVNASLPFLLSIDSHGVCKDGVIYFLGRDDNKCVMTIYALDIETESFEVVAVLDVGARPDRAFLELFNGTIYAQFFINESSQVQIWRMQVKGSWIKEFTVFGDDVVHTSFELLKASGNKKIFVRISENLFWLNKSTRTIRLKKKNKIKTLNIPSDGRRFSNVCSCLIETLHFGSLSSILAGDEPMMNG